MGYIVLRLSFASNLLQLPFIEWEVNGTYKGFTRDLQRTCIGVTKELQTFRIDQESYSSNLTLAVQVPLGGQRFPHSCEGLRTCRIRE